MEVGGRVIDFRVGRVIDPRVPRLSSGDYYDSGPDSVSFDKQRDISPLRKVRLALIFFSIAPPHGSMLISPGAEDSRRIKIQKRRCRGASATSFCIFSGTTIPRIRGDTLTGVVSSVYIVHATAVRLFVERKQFDKFGAHVSGEAENRRDGVDMT